MTTKTIPEYLEDERRTDTDTQRRTEEEAARVPPLHHGQRRTPKPPRAELPAPVETVAKARKTVAAKTRKPAAAAGKKPAAERKPGIKARERA
jgi:hypothetical protein